LRYSILKYYYTLFFTKQTQGEERKIGALFRPLFYDYYDEDTLPPYGHDAHETQVFLGEAIMIATVVNPNVSSIDVYFPNRRWYDLRSYEEIPMRGGIINVSGALTELIPYFLKGENVLLKQSVEGVMRTEDLSNTFTAIVGFGDFNGAGEFYQSYAEGKILAAASYDEQYVYDHCTKQNCILTIAVIYQKNFGKNILILKANEDFDNSSIDPIQINEVLLMGVSKQYVEEIKSVRLEGYNNFDINLEISANGNINLKFPALEFENQSTYKFMFS